MKDALLFDFQKCDFVIEDGNPVVVSGKDALKVWIDKILHTQLNRYKIYNGTGYGANIEDMVIGKPYGMGFTQSELKREMETALLQHEDIYSLKDFNVTNEKDKLIVRFSLETKYGKEGYIYDG